MKRLSLLAFAAIAVVGCTTATGPRYERANGPGDSGYSDVRLDENRYRVQYRADGDDYGVAQDFAMRRAAQLTLDRRYQWFQVVGRSRAVSDDAFTRYDESRYADSDRSNRDRPPYASNTGDDVVVLEIVMGYNPPPKGSSIYDPRRVLDTRYDDRRY